MSSVSLSSCSSGVVVFLVVVMRGRAGCLSLLLLKSLSIASQLVLSSAAVSQVMSLVKSLLHLLDLSGRK